jgi:hemerythrin superfamily protein
MTDDVRVIRQDASDLIEFLLNQHQQIRGLLDDVLASTGEERQRFFDAAREMLARHETAEEMIVRPLTRTAPEGGQVADGRMAEENEAKQVLADLEKMDVDSEAFTETFARFRQSVLGHVQAEETHEFPLLRQNTDPDALVKAGTGSSGGGNGTDPPAPQREDDGRELRGGALRGDARPGAGRLQEQHLTQFRLAWWHSPQLPAGSVQGFAVRAWGMAASCG